MQTLDTQTLLIVMVGVAAFAVLLQAAVLIAILVALIKATKGIGGKADEFRTTVIPLLERSRELLESTHSLVARVEPRFDSAASDLAEITQTARAQAVRLDATLGDIQDRIHVHAERIDGMATEVLNRVERTSRFVNETVRRPARHVSGAIAAARAFVDTFSHSAPRRDRNADPANKDL